MPRLMIVDDDPEIRSMLRDYFELHEFEVDDVADGPALRTAIDHAVDGDASDLDTAQIAIAVRAKGFNPRHLRLDGTRLVLDLKKALYGVPSEAT